MTKSKLVGRRETRSGKGKCKKEKKRKLREIAEVKGGGRQGRNENGGRH